MSWQFSDDDSPPRVGFVPAGKLLPAGSCSYDSKSGWNLTPSARARVGQGLEHPIPPPPAAGDGGSSIAFFALVAVAGLVGLAIALPAFSRGAATRAVF